MSGHDGKKGGNKEKEKEGDNERTDMIVWIKIVYRIRAIECDRVERM